MKKNVAIIVLAVLMLAAAGVAVYFKIDSKNNEESLNETIGELSAKLESLEGVSSSVSTNAEECKSEEKIVEKYALPELDSSNCINGESGNTYSKRVSASILGIYITRNDDKKSVTITVNPNDLKQYYNLEWNDDYSSATATNFQNEIEEIYVGSLSGQAVGEEVALFLMKDGTVEYIPLYRALKNVDIRSYGKVSGVSDIVSISSIDVVNSEGYGYRSMAAIKSDGSFYDIRNILRNEL